jgi:manganese/zinc/iron transport system substrate-binding protein
MIAKNLFLVILISVLFFSCTENNDEKLSDEKLKVTSTTGIITDALEYIAGDKIEIVATICGPGIDPHSYIPTTQDIININNSDLILYNGLNLEAKMGDIFESLEKSKAIALADAIPKDSLINNSTKSDILDFDPHIWNDPLLWINSVNLLINVLSEKMPENKELFRKKGNEYIENLKSAYNYAKSKYDLLPVNQRVIISEHDAFQYFARAYNFEVHSVLGMNTDTEAGIKTIQDLTDYIVKNKIKSLFAETIINHRGIQALVNSSNNRGWEINIADQPLYSDALDKNPPRNSLTGIMKYNADVIYEALK